MRTKKHPTYNRIKGYQILKNFSNSFMAKQLGMSTRTYIDKVSGYSDFTAEQGRILASLLETTQDDIFLL